MTHPSWKMAFYCMYLSSHYKFQLAKEVNVSYFVWVRGLQFSKAIDQWFLSRSGFILMLLPSSGKVCLGQVYKRPYDRLKGLTSLVHLTSSDYDTLGLQSFWDLRMSNSDYHYFSYLFFLRLLPHTPSGDRVKDISSLKRGRQGSDSACISDTSSILSSCTRSELARIQGSTYVGKHIFKAGKLYLGVNCTDVGPSAGSFKEISSKPHIDWQYSVSS